MIYRFDPFELDTDRGTLTGPDGAIDLEPRAWDVLTLLLENHDRLIGKDELIASVWGGRFVSDAAVATPIKAIRRALGDDGREQRILRTVRGRGFRFAAPVRVVAPARPDTAGPEPAPAPSSGPGDVSARPKIAVLPFDIPVPDPALAAMGDGIPTDLITTLSRLRWLDVVARGTSFRFRGEGTDPGTLHALTGATYVLTGSVELLGPQVAASVELADTRSGTAIWADRLEVPKDDLHTLRPRIVHDVLSALDLQIARHEAALARVRPSEQLDAWGAYHIGLGHMYRFNPHDNALAETHLKRATDLDPGFSAAWSARSFTRFQSAFLRFGADNAAEIAETRRLADRAYDLDPDDPLASFSIGRALWLEHRSDEGLSWLDQAIEGDPSFARAIYTRAVLNVHLHEAEKAEAGVVRALDLSPLDPLVPAAMAAGALSRLQRDDPGGALDWAERAARSPRTHYIAMYPALIAPALLGDRERALGWLARVQQKRPDATVADIFRSIPFRNAGFADKVRRILLDLGLPEG